MKGQYFSFDAIVGASIFILTLVAIMSYWYGVSSSIEQQQTGLSKEAMRVSDMVFSSKEVPYGVLEGWDDRRINYTRINTEFCRPKDASERLGSPYGVAVHFSTISGSRECWWYSTIDTDLGDTDTSGTNYVASNDIFRMRRVSAYLYTGTNEFDWLDEVNEPGYVDIYIYNPYLTDD